MLFLLASTLGCVPKGRHEIVEVQLDATRTALSARTAACYTDVQERENKIRALVSELDAMKDVDNEQQRRLLQLSEELQSARDALAAAAVNAPDPDDPEAMGPLNDATQEDIAAALAQRSRVTALAESRAQRHSKWVEQFAPLVEKEWATVMRTGDTTTVRIPSVIIFEEGKTRVSPRGELALEALVQAMKGAADARVTIRGHTDDEPYHTAEHASNWERGFAEAVTVLRSLKDAGVEAKLTAASAAGTVSVASDDTREGRRENNRLELVISLDPA